MCTLIHTLINSTIGVLTHSHKSDRAIMSSAVGAGFVCPNA